MARYLLCIPVLFFLLSCAELEPLTYGDGQIVPPGDSAEPEDSDPDGVEDSDTALEDSDDGRDSLDTGSGPDTEPPTETSNPDSDEVPEIGGGGDSETEPDQECKNNNQCDLGYYCNAKKLCRPCVVNNSCGIQCAPCSDPKHPQCSQIGPINLASLLLTGCGCTANSCGIGRRCSKLNLPNFAKTCEDCNTDGACGPNCKGCGGVTPRCIDGAGCGCAGDEDCGEGMRCDLDSGANGQCVEL